MITLFWKKVVSKLDDNQHVVLLFRVQLAQTGGYKTFGKLQRLSKNDMDFYINFVNNHFTPFMPNT